MSGGETCDPGLTVASDSCCPFCQPAPANVGCTADQDLCTADLCDGSGACTHVRLGDAGTVVKHAFAVKGLDTPDPDDTLVLRGTLDFGTTPTIDPQQNGLGIQIADASKVPLLDVTVPPGAFDGTSGWKRNSSGHSFRYRSSTPLAGILTQATVRTRPGGRVQVAISGRRGSVAPLLPGVFSPSMWARVVLDPLASPAGCSEIQLR